MFFNRRKILDTANHLDSGRCLKRTLGWPHLVALGVGAIVGTGIYTLTGVGADRAGPAVILAFAIAGVVCVCAALAYAEMATLMPAAGSAYTYTYIVGGELLAWVVGWSLILEYSVVSSVVAVGWSGYAAGFLHSAGLVMPAALLSGYHAGGVVNLPAVLVVIAVAAMLIIGARESATLNIMLVGIKIVALVVFIGLAGAAFHARNFVPFMPYGFSAHTQAGVTKGVMAAAAIIFFAFYGFDAVSTAAEEARNPGRDLKWGILGSMVVCAVLYMAVAAAALGAMPYTQFATSPEPLAEILRALGSPRAATLIGAAAVLALPTVILSFLFGQSRILFVMARDGLLPERLSRVNARTGTPVAMTLVAAVIVAVVAGLFPIAEIAALANAGTLCAFVAASLCMLALRVREPSLPRVFRAPLPWLVGPMAVAGCCYLFVSLPATTRYLFFIWNSIGVVVYFAYSVNHSRLASAPRNVPRNIGNIRD